MYFDWNDRIPTLVIVGLHISTDINDEARCPKCFRNSVPSHFRASGSLKREFSAQFLRLTRSAVHLLFSRWYQGIEREQKWKVFLPSERVFQMKLRKGTPVPSRAFLHCVKQDNLVWAWTFVSERWSLWREYTCKASNIFCKYYWYSCYFTSSYGKQHMVGQLYLLQNQSLPDFYHR